MRRSTHYLEIGVLSHAGDDFRIGRKTSGCPLRVRDPVADAKLERAPARTEQRHLGVWSNLADECRRLTGTRLVVSLAAVFNLDAHRSLLLQICQLMALER
jgi:hypothetical protein